MIDIKNQEKLLLSIATKLKKPITIYAIGGTAMMFQGYKDITKDIDLVFDNEKNKTKFIEIVKELGYKPHNSIRVYGNKKENQPVMFVGPKDERFDIFNCEVIHFTFSKNMIQRSKDTHEFNKNLIIKIADPHDIILMKCATDRKKDKIDAINIINNTIIDWDILIEEAKLQIELGQETAAMELGEFLEELQKIIPKKIPKNILNKLYTIVKNQMNKKLKF